MKQFEKFIYHTSFYSVIITVCFFLLAKLSGMAEVALPISRFLLIVLFGAFITISEFVFCINKIPKFFKYAINFLSLFLTFLIVFVSISRTDKNNPTFVFAALIIFTVVYFSILLLLLLIKSKLIKKTTDKPMNKQKPKKDEYKSRFS